MSNSPYDPQSNASSPYQQSQQHNPYAAGQGQQGDPYGGQPNPYAQSQQHNPYEQQQNPYASQSSDQQGAPANPYMSQGQSSDPYGQAQGQSHDPYGQQPSNSAEEAGHADGSPASTSAFEQPTGEQGAYGAAANAQVHDDESATSQADNTNSNPGPEHDEFSSTQPQADDGSTVLAPAGWGGGASVAQRPAEREDDDATVLAPSSWSGEQSTARDEDDSTVLAPSSWSGTQESAPAASGDDGSTVLAPGVWSGTGTNASSSTQPADAFAGQSQPSAAPYGQASADPYGQSADPYGQQSAAPYGQQSAAPYGQPSAAPYSQQSAAPYAPQSQPSAPGFGGPNQPYAEPQGYHIGQQGAPMGGPMGGPMAGSTGSVDQNGMLLQGSVPSQLNPQEERSQASMAHWLAILVQWLGPLIIMLTGGEKSPWVKQHAQQSLNFELTLLIGYIVSIFLMFIGIGLFTYPVVWVLGLVFHIQGAMAANKGQNFKYPIAIQFFK